MKHVSEAEDVLRRFRWPDANVDRFVIDYDDFKILLEMDGGERIWLVCGGYVGHEVVGFWDEMIVQRISVSGAGALLDRCVAGLKERLGAVPAVSGSPARNGRHLMQLDLTLIDGCEVSVVMNHLHVQKVEGEILAR